MNAKLPKLISRQLSFVSLLVLCACVRETARAAADPVIPFAAKLTDRDGRVIDGQRMITFSLYTNAISSNMIWCEVYTNIAVSKGIIGVNLGGVASLASVSLGNDLWLGIKVGADSEMIPRVRIPSQGGVPQRTIVMWSGSIASIPSGWALCDGNNGTPSLTNRFVVGAAVDQGGIAMTTIKGTAMQVGGTNEVTLTVDQIPPHTHSYSVPSNDDGGGSGEQEVQGTTGGQTGSAGGGQPHENCPPFFALAFIMKL